MGPEELMERILYRLEELFHKIDHESQTRASQFELLCDIETNARLLVSVQRKMEQQKG